MHHAFMCVYACMCVCAHACTGACMHGCILCMHRNVNVSMNHLQVYEFMYPLKGVICRSCVCVYLEHACCYFVFPCNRCNKEHFELWALNFITFGLLHVMSRFSPGIFYMGIHGFATDCPCGVWCRVLTTCLLYAGPLFGNVVGTDSVFVSLTSWRTTFWLF